MREGLELFEVVGGAKSWTMCRATTTSLPPTRLLFARLLLNVHVQSCRDLRVSPLLSALCMRQYNTPGGVRALGAGGAGARGSRAKAARGMLRRSNASVHACSVLRRHPFVLPEFSMTVGPCVPAPATRPPSPPPRTRADTLAPRLAFAINIPDLDFVTSVPNIPDPPRLSLHLATAPTSSPRGSHPSFAKSPFSTPPSPLPPSPLRARTST